MVEPHTLTFDMSHIAQQYILCVLAIVNGDRRNVCVHWLAALNVR